MDRYEGFHEFVQARGPALSRTAFLLTGAHHLAEDLLQQALANTAAHWPKVASGGNPEGYVRRAMINLRTSWWRRRKFIEVPPIDGVTEREQVPDQAEAVVRRLAVLYALATLAPKQRAAVVLRYFEDLTEPQIAEELGCSVGTVKSHARRQGKSGTAGERSTSMDSSGNSDCGAAPRRGSERYGWPG